MVEEGVKYWDIILMEEVLNMVDVFDVIVIKIEWFNFEDLVLVNY